MKQFSDQLHGALHRPEHPAYRPIQVMVWVLISTSIGILFYEQFILWGPKPAWLDIMDRLVLALFGIEVFLRILTYRTPLLQFYDVPAFLRFRLMINERIRFCSDPFIIIDLLTLLAVYPALRGLRALRLLQLLRTSQYFRYSSPLRRMGQAFRDNGLLFTSAFSLLGMGTLIGGFSLFLIEGKENPGLENISDGIWWALVTLTTVGFGDIAPVTGMGRILGGVLMVLGMFILALFAGIVGTTLLRAFISLREDQFRMSNDVGHLVICGYDSSSHMLLRSVLLEVQNHKMELVIFAPGERPPDIPPQFRWITGEASKSSELDKARLAQAQAVIIVGSRDMDPQAADALTILTAFTIRSYMNKMKTQGAFRRKQPLYVVGEILDSENVEHAEAAGCDEVIETNALGYSMLTHAIFQHGTAHVMSMIGTTGQQSLWVGELPEDLALPATFGVISHKIKTDTNAMVIGVHQANDTTETLNPPDDMMVHAGTNLIYLAPGPVLAEVDDQPD